MFDADPQAADRAFEASVVQGLSQAPRRIPSKWLYDDVGAALFEGIVASDGYYVARAERAILDACGPRLGETLGSDVTLVELGSGASVKVRSLLDTIPGLKRYVPLEISEAQLVEAAEAIRADYPAIEVLPLVADYTQDVVLPDGVGDGPTVGLFLGTTLCNLHPDESEAFLRRMHSLLGPDAFFLAGVDLVKDPALMAAAYNAPGGAMWDFNLNIVTRMNRELGTALDIADFRHEATYNAALARIEAALYPLRDLTVRIGGQDFNLPAGAPIVLEYSYKYTIEAFSELAARAGWTTVEAWTDPERLCSIHFLTNRSAV
ncbi:L-histidine N(alpha)-methyltransferase [Brevundimonas sp. LM2]|uniref:L-histidine N(alpha)-methyltransferase n=1 Tax=Brevundimonas sp. LM2 TaxID=1938605 RepID=UPI000983F481|nr:L-histidine N(alpha)-methyltransferase [Brevundimonas sp. LM2]AQR61421.1 L-histidine N(alpha)-methyltransferase [Brevundimonas sp. LM2]